MVRPRRVAALAAIGNGGCGLCVLGVLWHGSGDRSQSSQYLARGGTVNVPVVFSEENIGVVLCSSWGELIRTDNIRAHHVTVALSLFLWAP
jgi:hypothetical protein